ncbi:hypothetical protein J6590_013873 [Homalodisca vitripennis]|nr:hypothetical protein J6590_013873 [Homalodisca vitripennis]
MNLYPSTPPVLCGHSSASLKKYIGFALLGAFAQAAERRGEQFVTFSRRGKYLLLSHEEESQTRRCDGLMRVDGCRNLLRLYSLALTST